MQSKIRTGSHSLKIETSKHNRNKDHVVEADRLCSRCAELEDERHFMLHCPKYTRERQVLYKTLSLDNIFFESFSDDDKLLYIFNAIEKDHLMALAKYTHSAFILHNDDVTQ